MVLEMSFTLSVFVFVLSALCIWYFCNKLSDIVDYIDDVFQLGSAFGGTIMLSVVTNLPEIAITMNGAFKGKIDVAIGNVLGGITVQSILLVLFDFASRKQNKPLSALTSSKTSIVQGLFLIVILSLVIIGRQVSNNLMIGPISPIELLIVLMWMGSIYSLKKLDKPSTSKPTISTTLKLTKTSALIWLFCISIIVLIFGLLLETTSNNIANRLNINGVLFGATVLALVTSLPEISGGLEFIKNKSYKPIIGDIWGGNSFLPTLFLPASIITGKAILPNAANLNIYLTAVSIIITTIYMIGMMVNNHQRKLGMGYDSWIALSIYLLSIIGLLFIN